MNLEYLIINRFPRWLSLEDIQSPGTNFMILCLKSTLERSVAHTKHSLY